MKKVINKYKVLVVLAVIFGLSSCDNLLDINEDPNNPGIENATPEVLFPSAVMSSAGMIGGQLTIVGGIWSQYWAQSSFSNQYKEIDSYNLTRINEEVNLPYEELMAGALADYNLAIQKSKERGDWRYNLMCVVMKAYTFQVLADLYDQVPYSEAFQGNANLQPKFDDGYSIYEALLAEINDALSQDYKSNPFDASQQKTDFLFGGNMDRWEQFANTLKLKMYLRMVNAKPAEAQQGITDLYNAGANFLQVGAGVTSFVDVPNKSNPFYEFNIRRLNTTTNIRASITFVSWLTLHKDPRAVSYFGSANPIGIHQGDFNATVQEQPTYGNASVFVQKATDPVWFISAAESNFMQAEALERYFGGAGAKEKYDAGVTAAFAELALTPGTLLTGDYAYPVAGTFEQKLEAIITQKWAAFPGSHALEAFFEQARTGYPQISPIYSTQPGYIPGHWVYAKNGFTQGRFPKRLVFPDYEHVRNSNTPAEVPIYTNVWWAKQ